MSINRTIDHAVQKVRESKLTEVNKLRAIRMLEAIRTAVHALRQFIKSLIACIREHQDAIQILGFALLVGMLAEAIPLIGSLIAFLVMLVGAGAALAAEIKSALNGLVV